MPDSASTGSSRGLLPVAQLSQQFATAFAAVALAQPASASICERINSEFAFIKDPRRNRLGHEKANKLVAIFHNLFTTAVSLRA